MGGPADADERHGHRGYGEHVTPEEFRKHVARYATDPADELLTAWPDRPALPALPIFGF